MREQTGEGTVFARNQLSGGDAANWTYALRLFRGSAVIDANRVNADADHPVVAPLVSPNNWSGGIELVDSSAVVTNNLVYGANSNTSAALVIRHAALVGADTEVIVSSNTLMGGFVDPAAPLNLAASLVLARTCTLVNCTRNKGRFRNNIFTVPSGNIRYPVWEANGNGYAVLQPEVFEYNVLYLPEPAAGTQHLYREATGSSTDIRHATVDAVNTMKRPDRPGWQQPRHRSQAGCDRSHRLGFFGSQRRDQYGRAGSRHGR